MPRNVDVGSNKGVVFLCLPTVYFHNEGSGCLLWGVTDGGSGKRGAGSGGAQNFKGLRERGIVFGIYDGFGWGCMWSNRVCIISAIRSGIFPVPCCLR